MKNISSTNFQQTVSVKEPGKPVKEISSAFFRGANGVQFNPYRGDFSDENFLQNYVLKGWLPEVAQITQSTRITTFGSCFAENICKHLSKREFNLSSEACPDIYISYMGEGMVNVHAIAQQFEWALENKEIPEGLWHGWKAEDYGVDEDVRLATRDAFLATEFFIITLGLSEVWEDSVTKEVFWRAVPLNKYDKDRHVFRVLTMDETKAKIRKVYDLIRKYVPDAKVLFTLSPIPLAATFREISCITANSVSKSILRASLDEFLRDRSDDLRKRLFYFPSYEIISELFFEKYGEDGRHPHPEVIDMMMLTFEASYCESKVDWADVERAFKKLRKRNLQNALDGFSN